MGASDTEQETKAKPSKRQLAITTIGTATVVGYHVAPLLAAGTWFCGFVFVFGTQGDTFPVSRITALECGGGRGRQSHSRGRLSRQGQVAHSDGPCGVCGSRLVFGRDTGRNTFVCPCVTTQLSRRGCTGIVDPTRGASSRNDPG